MGDLFSNREDLNKVEVNTVVNGVDSANAMSVTSITPIKTEADVLEKKEEDTEKKEDKTEEKKIDKNKTEENVEDKKEDKKENKSASEENHEVDSVQKRINKAVKKQRIAERERDFERGKREEVEKELAKLKANVPSTDKPKLEDFISEVDYMDALIDWKIEQSKKTSSEATQKITEDKKEKEALQELQGAIDDMVEQGKEKYKDFNEIALAKDLVITPELVEVILESSVPADVMYYLGKNPDIAEELSGLSMLKAARKIAVIESEISKPSEKKDDKIEKKETEKKPQTEKKITNAPDPIEPVHVDGTNGRRPEDMSPSEYRKWREQNK